MIPELREKAKKKPPCFTSEQWRDWIHACRSTNCKPDAMDTYCEDCTPEFQRKKMKVGDCVWPDTVFVPDSDGMIHGKRLSLRVKKTIEDYMTRKVECTRTV